MNTASDDPDDPEPALVRSTIVEYESAPDECTIFLSGVPRHERMATWITAKEGSYVDLDAVR